MKILFEACSYTEDCKRLPDAFDCHFFLHEFFLCLLLGTYCNSASACFVASDGKNLRLYQAVVDARKLLDELSDPESSVSFMKQWFGLKLLRYN